jgi:hypothetical protein
MDSQSILTNSLQTLNVCANSAYLLLSHEFPLYTLVARIHMYMVQGFNATGKQASYDSCPQYELLSPNIKAIPDFITRLLKLGPEKIEKLLALWEIKSLNPKVTDFSQVTLVRNLTIPKGTKPNFLSCHAALAR